MSTEKDTKALPDADANDPKDPQDAELKPDELEQVSGGIALLVPAVQKVREAAASSSDDLPTESISFNFTKISK